MCVLDGPVLDQAVVLFAPIKAGLEALQAAVPSGQFYRYVLDLAPACTAVNTTHAHGLLRFYGMWRNTTQQVVFLAAWITFLQSGSLITADQFYSMSSGSTYAIDCSSCPVQTLSHVLI